MSLLKRIEKAMDQRLRALFSGGADEPGAREAVELYRDALEQVAGKATAGKRGNRIFAYNLITIELIAHTADRKAVLQTLFEPGQLVEDIKTTLREERVTPPAELTVVVHYPREGEAELRVVCERTEKPADVAAAMTAVDMKPARLVRIAGGPSSPEFELSQPLVNLGRQSEVVDTDGRAIRRNDLWFPDEAHEFNSTVSRSHAHIRFDASLGMWKIFDDGSSLGTSLFREGRRIEVPAHGARGVALRAGDEINLGQVRLRFDMTVKGV